MKAIKQSVDDYDDYYDLCNELEVTPVSVVDRSYYLHMQILKKVKNKVELRYPGEYYGRSKRRIERK